MDGKGMVLIIQVFESPMMARVIRSSRRHAEILEKIMDDLIDKEIDQDD